MILAAKITSNKVKGIISVKEILLGVEIRRQY
jgi:hypothetical protein